ncbi:hypothetical protein [Bradyrhizobium retamae]|uniref:hypothetical protein n=1 Tax=Bradyrhizobium retamae TaxID=1300035 RepID=UPI0032213F99
MAGALPSSTEARGALGRRGRAEWKGTGLSARHYHDEAQGRFCGSQAPVDFDSRFVIFSRGQWYAEHATERLVSSLDWLLK